MSFESIRRWCGWFGGVPSAALDALEWHTAAGEAFGATVDAAATRAEHGRRRIRSVAMPQLRRIRQIEPDDAGAAASAPDVRLQRVVPAVSVHVAARADDLEPGATTAAKGIELRVLLAVVRTRAARSAIAVLGLMAALAVVLGDVRVGVGGVLLVAAVVSIRFIDRNVTFSFGQGFVGYRADMGWPQGVQEDDDFRWDWRPRTVGHATERRS
jgi:hypothetical protein